MDRIVLEQRKMVRELRICSCIFCASARAPDQGEGKIAHCSVD